VKCINVEDEVEKMGEIENTNIGSRLQRQQQRQQLDSILMDRSCRLEDPLGARDFK